MQYTLKNDMVIDVRDVNVSDAAAIVVYFKLVNTQTKNLLREPNEADLTIEDEIKFLEKMVSSSDECMFMGLHKGIIIGLAGFHGSNLKRITHKVSFGISLLRDYRSLGIGTVLMEILVQKAKEHGKKKIELDVRIDNPRAIRVYEKLGFIKEGVRKNSFYVDGKYIDLYLMGLWIEEEE